MIFWSFLRGRFEAVAPSNPIIFIGYNGEFGRDKSIALIKLVGLLRSYRDMGDFRMAIFEHVLLLRRAFLAILRALFEGLPGL